jgi:hypothetical protein
MKWNRIKSLWPRTRGQLKSTWESFYGALNVEWLAKLRLKDHYAEKRPRS